MVDFANNRKSEYSTQAQFLFDSAQQLSNSSDTGLELKLSDWKACIGINAVPMEPSSFYETLIVLNT